MVITDRRHDFQSNCENYFLLGVRSLMSKNFQHILVIEYLLLILLTTNKECGGS